MADKVKKRKLVVIDEGTLAGMAVNPAISAEFPFLKNLSTVTRAAGRAGGCGSCGAAAKQKSAAYAAAKLAIAGLAGDRKRKLKELLNAEAAQILYKNTSGKTENLRF